MKIFDYALILQTDRLNSLRAYLKSKNSIKILITIIGETNAEIDFDLQMLMRDYPKYGYVITTYDIALHFIELADKVIVDRDLLDDAAFVQKLPNCDCEEYTN
jgi:hypothetical protein